MRDMAGQQFHGGDVLRKLRGKTPKTKFAKKARLARQTVARFEEAPAKAQPETIRRIAAALKMTPVELKEAMGLDERKDVQPQKQQSAVLGLTAPDPLDTDTTPLVHDGTINASHRRGTGLTPDTDIRPLVIRLLGSQELYDRWLQESLALAQKMAKDAGRREGDDHRAREMTKPPS